MKKISKLFIVALVFVLTLSLTACKKDEKKEEAKSDYNEYIGYQFSGKDPWGEELAVTIRTLKDDVLEWTYTDVIGKGENSATLYNELKTELKNGATSFAVKGDAENKQYSFEYSGTLTLKDGKLIIAFEKGQLTTNSTEGGSTSHNVGALEDVARTITLTKVEDNA